MRHDLGAVADDALQLPTTGEELGGGQGDRDRAHDRPRPRAHGGGEAGEPVLELVDLQRDAGLPDVSELPLQLEGENEPKGTDRVIELTEPSQRFTFLGVEGADESRMPNRA